MDQETLITEIEVRALRAGVSIRTLCGRAGVHPTTFSRWKKTKRNPEPIGATLQSINRLYDALSSFEDERSRKAARKSVRA